MVRYGSALVVLVCQALMLQGQAFQPLQLGGITSTARSILTTQRHNSASFRDYADNIIKRSDSHVENSPSQVARSATAQRMDALLAEPTAARRMAVQARLTQGGETYKVTLPLVGAGLSIGQVAVVPGLAANNTQRILQDVELDLNSLQMVSSLEQQQQQQERIAALPADLDPNFLGCLVTAVLKESVAWEQGVRPGDVVVATSATLGEGMWPKSSLAAVQSALTSRAAMANKFTLELQTPVAVTARASKQDNRYELSIRRPTGLKMQDSADGYVVVTAIADNAPAMVRAAVQVGDHILAVDSAWGDRLWPVSTTEGVMSACTSRMHGQAVRMRFERPRADMVTPENTVTMLEQQSNTTTNATAVPKTARISQGASKANQGASTVEPQLPATSSKAAAKVLPQLNTSTTASPVTKTAIKSLAADEPNKKPTSVKSNPTATPDRTAAKQQSNTTATATPLLKAASISQVASKASTGPATFLAKPTATPDNATPTAKQKSNTTATATPMPKKATVSQAASDYKKGPATSRTKPPATPDNAATIAQKKTNVFATTPPVSNTVTVSRSASEENKGPAAFRTKPLATPDNATATAQQQSNVTATTPPVSNTVTVSRAASKENKGPATFRTKLPATPDNATTTAQQKTNVTATTPSVSNTVTVSRAASKDNTGPAAFLTKPPATPDNVVTKVEQKSNVTATATPIPKNGINITSSE